MAANKTKKRIIIALSILALPVILVGAAVLYLSYAPVSRTPIYEGNPLYDEAKAQSQKFWESAFVRCGDSFYGVITLAGEEVPSKRWIFQLKNPEIVTYYDPEKELSEAQKLNRVEFDGKTFVQSSAYRSYQEGKWSDWVDGSSPFHEATSTSIRKVKGTWIFGIDKNSRVRFTKTTCTFIPK